MNGGVSAVVELLPRIAALPTRDALDSYKLEGARALEVRRNLLRELLGAVPLAYFFPPGVATMPAALALLEQNDWRLSLAQQRADADARATDARAENGASAVVGLPEYSANRRGMACGHVFRKGEPIFRCHDCSFDDTCVQCATCFQHSIHAREDHDVVFSVADESGACCDCGDEEAWKCDLGCEFHSMHPHNEGAANGAAPLPALDESFPPAPRAALRRFFHLLLAFCLQVLGAAPEQRAPILNPELVEELKRMPTLEDQFGAPAKGKARDVHTAAPPLPHPYVAVLWNDEKHTFNQVSEKILEVVSGMTVQGSRYFAEQVDKYGREVLAVSTEIRRLVLMAKRINMIDLMVTIMPAFDFFVQEVTGCVLDTLKDLATCSLYLDQSGAKPDGRPFKVLLTDTLLLPWHQPEICSVPNLCMLDALLLMDTKMWKSARLDVRHMLMDLIAYREAKQSIAVRFAHVYIKLIETFILRDREPEHSIYHLTVQIFSVPSIAARLVIEHGFMHTLLQVLHALFVSDQEGATSLVVPAPPPARGQANANASLLRQQKCYQVFHDTRYLLSASDVQDDIAARSGEYLSVWLAFFAMFHSIAPDTRAAHAHVEFESELWIQVFHTSSHLGKLAKLLGEAFSRASEAQLRAALGYTGRTIIEHTQRLQALDPATHQPGTLHTTRYPVGAPDDAVASETFEFDVASQPVSFHHPMHWLFAEMLKSLAHGPPTPGDLTELEMLAILEYPLRVAVKLAQIRCNVWVRNGFAIRSQAYHYRDSMWMRDIMYDQDMFLQQCGLAFVDHDPFLLTVLDRFDLVAWFSGAPRKEHAVYDADQTLFMAEELLLLLIMLLTEISVPAHWTIEQQVCRELIHYLVLGPGTYSEVTKQIPERFTDHSCFDRELARIAHFRSPDGTSDLGMYELKPEYFAQVQPFFHHYSRNQRERAEEVLAERRAKPGGEEAAPLTIAPQLGALQDTPFHRLADVFTNRTFLTIVFYALANTTSFDEPPDTLLNAGLHLLMLGLVERGAHFAPALIETRRLHGAPSLLHILLELQQHPKLEAYHPKVNFILQHAAALDTAVASHLPSAYAQRAAPPPQDDAKRRIARERQAAIMQQFSAQQKSLLESLDEGLSDEEAPEEDSEWGACIMCQERLDTTSAFGTLGHIQESRLVRTTPPREHSVLDELLRQGMDMDRAQGDRVRGSFGREELLPNASVHQHIALGYPAQHHTTGFVAVSCGHSMHVRCFNMYIQSIEHRHAMQIARNHPEDLARFEFVCPLCKSLGNTLLPVSGASALSTSPFTDAARGAVLFDDQPLTEWVRRMNIAILKNTSTENAELEEHGWGYFAAFMLQSSAQPQNSEYAHGLFSADECLMLQRYRSVLQLLGHETIWARTKDRMKTILDAPHTLDSAGDVVYLPETLLGYTLAQLEIAQRGHAAQGDVGNALSAQQVQLLQSQLDALTAMARVASVDARTDMRQSLLRRLMPHWAGEHAVRSPLLVRNALGVLVEVALLIPEYFMHATALLYYVTLIQTIFGLAQPTFEQGERRKHAACVDGDVALSIFPHARWLVTSVVNLVGYVRGNITLGFDQRSDQELAKLLCAYTLPFLRRAALLGQAVGRDVRAAEVDLAAPEYVRLLQHFRIPSPAEALPMHTQPVGLIAMLVEGWAKHAYMQLAPLFKPLPIETDGLEARLQVPSLILEHPHIYELLPLPRDLAVLLQQTQQRKCKRCNTLPPTASLCLFCGEVLCLQAYCCSDLDEESRGECNQHLEHCGGRVGAHFRVGNNVMVLLYQGNGCYSPSPYLNTHGEVDRYLLKARPQRLHTQRYDELRKQWLNHGIANLVTRRIESTIDPGGWITF
ncbi:RING-type E3 ubiquitin transferase [Malassezia vespertilionis]|uniref:E3 ubiquitin-protein ligase n=1 Tax=Malassezia vespertilionis TaxID=2020962 RepID=A0A2N1JCJ4_9BASI|nr:RING-type E3 ubiquitin transferase [Malassezia vespertilionis]PKI84280.1 hypothetical protein MVES_001520 [Malassezia vespertilionis]WFD06272.1 RING-type E3 ubiquitin transferase [Malassezia vespertilionis]